MSDPKQPRQPRDLEGLLKFCMEVTKREDAPGGSDLEQMSEERRQWLEEALRSMTVDVIQQLVEGIKILRSDCVLDADAPQDQVQRVDYALECICDYVDQIDTANNWHKLGGFDALKQCLNSPHDSIVAGAANVLAELLQNNPYCQEKSVSEGFLKILLDLLDHGPVSTKALLAVSCLVRDSPSAQQEFLRLDGPSKVMRALQGGETTPRFRAKAAFFMSSVCEENEQIRQAFISMGTTVQLAMLLQDSHHLRVDESCEFLTKALFILLRDAPEARAELMDRAHQQLDFEEFLRLRVQHLADKEESQEELAYLLQIKTLCSLVARPSSPKVDR